jgi:CheY-like chemotaxis protein
VVEDERLIARDLQGKLQKLGFDVAGLAGSKVEAIEIVERTMPDLVLMDIHLRGPFDGIEAACEIRGRLEIPVVYLTGHSDPETMKRAKQAEPYGYLLKPVNVSELQATLESALAQRDAEKWTDGDDKQRD